MNKYLRRLKALQNSEMHLGKELTKPSKPPERKIGNGQKRSSVSFVGSQPRHTSKNGIPHPRYGDDEFNSIRLPHPAILAKLKSEHKL
jgi:hypothetical protein